MNKDEQIKHLEEELSSAISEIVIISNDCQSHISFGVKMIVDGHITLEEYCDSMPWVHSHTAKKVVNKMKELIEDRHLNLTQEQIDEAQESLNERNRYDTDSAVISLKNMLEKTKA